MTSVLSSLQLLIKCLMASIDMLFWTFCLLTFLQCVAGMIVSTLCRDYIENPEYPSVTRDEVYRYYGTFTRTFLTMFVPWLASTASVRPAATRLFLEIPPASPPAPPQKMSSQLPDIPKSSTVAFSNVRVLPYAQT